MGTILSTLVWQPHRFAICIRQFLRVPAPLSQLILDLLQAWLCLLPSRQLTMAEWENRSVPKRRPATHHNRLGEDVCLIQLLFVKTNPCCQALGCKDKFCKEGNVTATLLKTDSARNFSRLTQKAQDLALAKATTRKLLHCTTRAASVLRTQVDIVRRQLIQPWGSLTSNRIYSTNILGNH